MGAPRHVVCVLGGTALQDDCSEALVQALARDLAAGLGPEVAFVTGGLPGVQRVFADHCGDGSRLWNLLPRAESSGYAVGRDVHAGADLAERKEVFGQLGDVYVTVEGGPGVAQECRAAAARGAAIVPLMRSGGASAGMFEFPPEALQRPAFATQVHDGDGRPSDGKIRGKIRGTFFFSARCARGGTGAPSAGREARGPAERLPASPSGLRASPGPLPRAAAGSSACSPLVSPRRGLDSPLASPRGRRQVGDLQRALVDDFAVEVWRELHAMHGHQLDVPAVSRERTPGAGHPICFGTEQDLAAACTKLHAAAGPARAGKAGEHRGGPPAAGTAPGRRRADVVQRLYSNEVSRQRRRDVKERWEKEEMQECTFTPKITRLVMAGVAEQVGSKADVSERLYAHGREREEALREAREQHLAREARLLQEKSVVSGPKSVPAWSVFERSRKWRSQVDRRIAERKEGAAQQEEKELQESSVHKRLNERLTGSAAAAKREEAVDRLYRIDLKKRKARADERIRSRQMDIEKEFQEQEMRSVHARAAARGRAGRRAAPLAGRGPGGEDEEVDEARRELVLALFDALGRGRERLGPPELRRLSGLCGFCGGDAAWGAQYEQLADIYGFEARQGLSADTSGPSSETRMGGCTAPRTTCTSC
ncbi:unnamed protein product [Prorocentrum cordatum]|uniref:Uncharacterized protein n=1 Tax=Prorocentrum cordatum TaxID=2364126 RepID=A0ABN9UDC4_9DINO|nr:unnamed protein product [Polarella glacialis]